jgi:hypothetical protein
MFSEEFQTRFANVPGGEIVERGLRDLRDGTLSEEALLALIARDRLLALGIDVPFVDVTPATPEHLLYSALEQRLPSGAHSAYNALIRRIVSFARAADLLVTDAGSPS